MNFKFLLLLATAFASTSKYMKIPVYWDDADHEENIELMNNLSTELSESLLFYKFEQLSSPEVDLIPIDREGSKAEKQLRGFLHEFYRNEDESKPQFKEEKSPSFEKLLSQRGKTIWFGAFGFDKSKTIKNVWKAMVIPFFYDSDDKEKSSKAQDAIGTLEKELNDKVTLWKYIPKKETKTTCPKSSSMQKQGSIIEVYATESEMKAKAGGTGFKRFAGARFDEDPSYQFGMQGFENVGAAQFTMEEPPQATEETPLLQPEPEASSAQEQAFSIRSLFRCPCAGRDRQKKE